MRHIVIALESYCDCSLYDKGYNMEAEKGNFPLFRRVRSTSPNSAEHISKQCGPPHSSETNPPHCAEQASALFGAGPPSAHCGASLRTLRRPPSALCAASLRTLRRPPSAQCGASLRTLRRPPSALCGASLRTVQSQLTGLRTHYSI